MISLLLSQSKLWNLHYPVIQFVIINNIQHVKDVSPFLLAAAFPVFDLVLILAMKSSSDLGTCFFGSSLSFLPSSSLNRDCLEGLSLLFSGVYKNANTSAAQ